MKECPICKSISFDDMEVCFGCLYNFESAPLQSIDLAELAEPVIPQLLNSSSSCSSPKDAVDSRALQCDDALDPGDQKHERGAHRKRVEPPTAHIAPPSSLTSVVSSTAPAKQLVVIPLEKAAGKENGAADEKSGYRIEINVVCV